MLWEPSKYIIQKNIPCPPPLPVLSLNPTTLSFRHPGQTFSSPVLNNGTPNLQMEQIQKVSPPPHTLFPNHLCLHRKIHLACLLDLRPFPLQCLAFLPVQPMSYINPNGPKSKTKKTPEKKEQPNRQVNGSKSVRKNDIVMTGPQKGGYKKRNVQKGIRGKKKNSCPE